MTKFFEKYLVKHTTLVQDFILDAESLKHMNKASSLIINNLKKNKKLLFIGNGGSAAEAQHMAAELVCKLNFKRKALSALALSTDTSILTSISNDFGYENVFYRQLEAIGNKGDILIAYSTSGKSKNVLNAIKYSNENGIQVIGFSGNDGFGKGLCEIEFKIKCKCTSLIQEMHNVIGHAIFSFVENTLFVQKD